jgi:hypothetical protein
MEETKLFVKRGKAENAALQETIDEIVAEIRMGEGEAATEARATGLEADGDLTVKVTDPGQGFEPVSTLAVVLVGAFGKELAKRVWVDVIRPEIRRRRGADAVGELEPEPASDDD